jgi:hypothetical protein
MVSNDILRVSDMQLFRKSTITQRLRTGGILLFLAVCSLQAQEIYKRSGQLIMVKNRLTATSSDTLDIVRRVDDQQLTIGAALFDRWTGHDTALWIISEKEGYTIDAGDIILALVSNRPSVPEDGNEDRAVFRVEEASRPTRDGYFITGASSRRALAGLSIGPSAGLFIAGNDTTYNGRGPYFYPELSLIFDISGLRVGITAGLLKRDFTLTIKERYWDPHEGWKTTRRDSSHHVQIFPILLDISMMPLRFSNPYATAQPYIGVSPGLTLSTGDRAEKVTLAFALKGGMAFFFSRWWCADMEIRYTIIPDGYSFLAFSTGFRFRWPFR